ncbi:vacuolar sorting protein 39 domain 1-domain-containing protein [Tuber brumale]|nr:vacuolar sorting protein 39 domain 1-domain-containing protein [Tuber brumale]
MLNAFNAHSIFELAPKERFKIESLLAYGDKLLLGLSNGTLRHYKVLSPDSDQISLELLRNIDKFSRRSIELLACIKEVQILVSLSDNYVHIHDLNEFTLTETLTKTKGASTFAVTSNIERDEKTQIPSIVSRLAIGVKKRLLLYSWHDEEFLEGKEVVLSGAVRSLTWASGRKVVVGLAGGFVVVDVRTGVMKEIVPPETKGGGASGPASSEVAGWGAYMGMGGWGSRPLSTHLGGDDLLLVKDSTTLFIDSEGAIIPNRRPVPWPASPDAVAFSYPYLVSLSTTKQHLEVRNPSTYTLLQTIHLNNVSILHVPPPNVSLVHAGKLFYIGSSSQVWRMTAADYETQIKQLIEGDHLDEAISLLEILESVLLDSKEEQLREVKMLKAERLFEKRKYRESMDLFTEVSAPPERVIRLFPKVIAGDLSICDTAANDSVDSGEAVDGSDAGSRAGTPECEACSTGAEPITPKKSGTPPPLNWKPPTPIPKKLNGANPETSSIRNISLTKKVGDASSIFNFGGGKSHIDDDAASIAVKHTETIPDGPPLLEGPELEKAADQLSAHLNDTRQALSKYFHPDGTLRGDPANIISNASSTSSTNRDPFEASFLAAGKPLDKSSEAYAERTKKLLAAARLIDTTLFKIYIITRPGLVGPFVRIQKHGDPEVFSEKLRELGKFTELIDFLYQRELHREALELLLQFGKSPEDERAPSLCGPRRTIAYLQSLKANYIDLILEFSQWPLEVDPSFGMEIFTADSENAESLPRSKVVEHLQSRSTGFAIQYLEHVIHELGDQTPEFHTRLIWLYLSTLKQMPDSAHHSEKLLAFLTASKQYRSEKVLGWLPREDPAFYEARAIVLRNMGQHKAALEIYVFKLHDHVKAEEYCKRIHLTSPTTPTIYHTLLTLYLRPPPPHTPHLTPALTLLSRHGARLEASETLALIPEGTTMASLESYFQSRIRAANSKASADRLTAMLRKSYLVDVQDRLLKEQGVAVVVGEERSCGVCHKRLGASVLWRLASGAVVHYGCAQKVG